MRLTEWIGVLALASACGGGKGNDSVAAAPEVKEAETQVPSTHEEPSPSLVGAWEGTGHEGGTIRYDFCADGTAKIVSKGKSMLDKGRFELDTNPAPWHLDFYWTTAEGEEVGPIPHIVELSQDQLRIGSGEFAQTRVAAFDAPKVQIAETTKLDVDPICTE